MNVMILATVGFSLIAAKPGSKEVVEVTEADLATRGVELFGDSFKVEARNDRQPDGSSCWGFAYSGNTGAYEIVEILYPKVTVRHTPAARLLYPHPVSPGRIAWPEWEKLEPGETIAETRMGVPAFRFVSVLEPDGESFYLDIRDTARDARTFRMRQGATAGTVEIAVRYPLSLTPANRRAFVSPLKGTMRTFRGGWFEAATIYKPWAVRQPWCTGAAARRKLSPAIDDVALWLWLRGPSSDTVPVVERVRRELGLPVGLDWYWWHAIPYDSGYPFFWPPREGEAKFRETVKRMNDLGVLMQVYTNGQAWDRDDPSWTRDGGINEVKMDRDGTWIEVAFNRYTRHRLSYVCGEAPKFQAHMLDLSQKLTGAGLKMYYIDQITAAAHGVCSNPAHTHAPGGGPQVADGFRAMIARIREKNPGVLLMSEEFSENYLDTFDMSETCFTCYERCGWGARPRVEVVPVVQALYHPHFRAMGSYSIMDGIPPWDPKWPDQDRWQKERDWKKEFPDQFAYEYCRTVVWGIQPTVHQLRLENLDDPRYAADCRFLYDTARFFHANRKYLWEGEMLPAGDLACETKPVDFMVRGIYTKDGEERKLRDAAVPTVLHSRWRAPDGSVATVVVNWTDERRRFVLDGRAGELAPKSWGLWRFEGVEAPISRWEDALPLGNGQAGALVWGGGDTLRLSLDRADYWHLSENTVFRNPAFNWTNLIVHAARDVEERKRIFEGRVGDSTKLPGVRLEMKFGGGVKIASFRLDMKKAEALVELEQGGMKKTLRAWFVSGDPLLHVAVPEGVSVASSEFVRNRAFDKLGGYPEPKIERTADVLVYTRGNKCAGAWAKGFTAGVRFVAPDAQGDLAWWRDFYAHSSVSVPDEKIQRFYDFAMYLYGSGSRTGFAPIALQGLWTADNGELPPWHGDYHHDLNSQMTYWASPVAGHFDSHDAFAAYMRQLTPAFESFARRFFGLDGGMVIPGAMGYDGSWIAGKSQYAIPPSNGLWAFSVLFDGWNYCPTKERLDAIYPFGMALADAAEQLLLPPDGQGVRRWPISTSPEFGEGDTSAWFPPNSNYDRSILIGFFSQMATLAKAKGDAGAERKYRELAGSFGPAVLTDDGRYLLAKGRDLTDSHRHISHLLDIFPYCRIAEGADARKSLDHFEGLGTKEWIGFTPVWAAAMEARLGAGDRALGYLRVFADKFVSKSGLHLNGDQTKSGYSNFTYHPFTLEANFCFARAVQEMLVGAYEDGIRIFPAVPGEWKTKGVSFSDLRVPGGHRVSAVLRPDGSVRGSVTGFSDGELTVALPCGETRSVSLRKGVAVAF